MFAQCEIEPNLLQSNQIYQYIRGGKISLQLEGVRQILIMCHSGELDRPLATAVEPPIGFAPACPGLPDFSLGMIDERWPEVIRDGQSIAERTSLFEDQEISTTERVNFGIWHGGISEEVGTPPMLTLHK